MGFGLLAFIILHHVGKTAPSSCANRVERKPREKSLALCDRAASEKWHTARLAVLIRPDVRFRSLPNIRGAIVMSALPPKADMCGAVRDAR